PSGYASAMLARHAAAPLRTALADRPVVLLHGARQTGKTTLVRAVAEEIDARYVTLDDLTMLAAARGDPAGFLAGFKPPLVLDEVQRAPELLLAIKAAVDRKRTPGRFLLTGSANVLLVPRVAESLAGRDGGRRRRVHRRGVQRRTAGAGPALVSAAISRARVARRLSGGGADRIG